MKIMWRRKLQEQGRVSLSISLPKEWTKEFNLKKGDEIVLNEDIQGNLIVNSSKKTKDMKRKIHLPKKIPNLRSEILSYYLHGVREIKISDTKKIDSYIRIKIKKMISSLIGFEIMDDSSNEILVKDMLNYSQMSIKDLLKRILRILISMYEDTYEAIIKKDISLSEGIVERDNEVNNLYLLTIKCIRSALAFRTFEDINMDYIEYLDHIIVSRDLERIGDCIKYINEFIVDSKIEFNSENTKLFKEVYLEVKKIFKQSLDAFFEKNIDRAINITKNSKKTEQKLQNLSKNIFKSEKNPQVINIANNFSKIFEYTIDIAQMVKKE